MFFFLRGIDTLVQPIRSLYLLQVHVGSNAGIHNTSTCTSMYCIARNIGWELDVAQNAIAKKLALADQNQYYMGI